MARNHPEHRDALLLVDLQESFFETPELEQQRAETVDAAVELRAAAQQAPVVGSAIYSASDVAGAAAAIRSAIW